MARAASPKPKAGSNECNVKTVKVGVFLLIPEDETSFRIALLLRGHSSAEDSTNPLRLVALRFFGKTPSSHRFRGGMDL
jgi:hypothetical protein